MVHFVYKQRALRWGGCEAPSLPSTHHFLEAALCARSMKDARGGGSSHIRSIGRTAGEGRSSGAGGGGA
jgi:hypothetical protein